MSEKSSSSGVSSSGAGGAPGGQPPRPRGPGRDPPRYPTDPIEDEEDEEAEDAVLRAEANRDAFFARLLRNVFVMDRRGDGGGGNPSLIERLKLHEAIKTPLVENAFRTIAREYFVTPDLRDEAYHDSPLRFSTMGFNISAPHMHALCLEEMSLLPGLRVLDIGCGSGALTALIAFIVGPTGHVLGLDLHEYIMDFCKANIARCTAATSAPLAPIELEARNCFLPTYPERLFDRIHVGACIPEAYLDQLLALLEPGGILVGPYGDELVRMNKDTTSGEVKKTAIASVRYSDLTLPSHAELREAMRLVEVARAQDIVVPLSQLAAEWASLTPHDANTMYSDITLSCADGYRFGAHRLILSLRSGPLQSEQWSNDEVSVTGTSAVWKVLLGWVYGDHCQMTTLILEERASLYSIAENLNWKSLVALLDASKALTDATITSLRTQSPHTLLDLLAEVIPTTENRYPRGADILFVLDDMSELMAHSLVLRVRANYFAAALAFGGRETRERRITIPDTPMAALLLVLRFLYTDTVSIDKDNAVSIIELSNFFQLPRLRALCEDFLCHHLSIDNAAMALAIAERFEAAQLRKFVQEFIYAHVEEIVETDGFRELDVSTVSRLLVDAVKRAQVDEKK